MSDRSDIAELLKAANDASAHARTIWITFLLFGTYLAITVGSTTHTDLFTLNPVALPLLQNVRLDLLTFYWVAPFLFVVYHLYALIAHYLLASKLHAFNAELAATPMLASERQRYRLQVHPSLIAQTIAGPLRGWFPTLAIRFTTWITLVLAPVVLLCAFQVRFLPYHSEAITWMHRGYLILDLVLLWAMWPVILHPSGRFSTVLADIGRRLVGQPARLVSHVRNAVDRAATAPEANRALAIVRELLNLRRQVDRIARETLASLQAALNLLIATIAVLAFSILVATVPGETVEQWLLTYLDDPNAPESTGAMTTQLGDRKALQLTATLFGGYVDMVSQSPWTLFSRNLVVIEQDLVGDVVGKKFRGRDFRYAVLDGSKLRAADLTGADLTGARLYKTDLREAQLSCATGEFECTELDGAILTLAQLQGANLHAALLNNVDAREADFSGAVLDKATIRNSALDHAKFVGASLSYAQLKDVSFRCADLRAIYWRHGSHRGVSFNGADLQAALFHRTNLHTIDLGGASVDAVRVADVQLRNAHGRPRSGRLAILTGITYEATASVQAPKRSTGAPRDVAMPAQPFAAEDDGKIECRRNEFLGSLSQFPYSTTLPRDLSFNRETLLTGASIRATDESHRREVAAELANELANWACDATDAPYVATGIARRLLRQVDPSEVVGTVAKRSLAAECMGAKGIPRDLRDGLRALANP